MKHVQDAEERWLAGVDGVFGLFQGEGETPVGEHIPLEADHIGQGFVLVSGLVRAPKDHPLGRGILVLNVNESQQTAQVEQESIGQPDTRFRFV